MRDFAPDSSPLLTDLYQFTMLQAYFDRDMHREAVFELFVRRLPKNRNFLIAAGLEQALDYLSDLRFTDRDIEVLKRTNLFHDEFLKWLRDLRFTGDVDALPEGLFCLRVMYPMGQESLPLLQAF